MKQNKWDKLNKELDDALEEAFGTSPSNILDVFENAKLVLREHLIANKEEVVKDLEQMREWSNTNKQETLEEVECNNCGYLMSLTEDESVYACYNSECTSCYEEYEEESKQETVEEKAEKYAESNQYDLAYYDEGGYQGIEVKSFAEKLVDFTTKWQQEKMYSEEELRKAIQLARLCTLDNVTGEFVDLSGFTEVCTYGLEETHSEDSIIEQFKKK